MMRSLPWSLAQAEASLYVDTSSFELIAFSRLVVWRTRYQYSIILQLCALGHLPNLMTTDFNRRHPFVRLLNYASVYKRRVALATLYSVLGKLFDIMPPVLIGMAVDIVVERQDSLLGRMGIADLSLQLIILGFLTLIVWLLESTFGYLQRIYWRNLAQSMQHDLRMDAYNHVQHLEMAYFEDQSTGGLMSVLNDDINQLERFLDVGATDVIQILTTVVAIGGIFVFIAPSVAWMAACTDSLYYLGLNEIPEAAGAALYCRTRTGECDQSTSVQ